MNIGRSVVTVTIIIIIYHPQILSSIDLFLSYQTDFMHSRTI